MQIMKTQKGITIVALIITIIVLLILAVVAIQAIQGEGIIVQATKSAFMSKAKKYEEELNLYINNKVLENINNGFDKSTLFANDITTPSIKEIIKSISKEDETKFVIREGKLEYIGEGTQEIEWSKDLGIESKNKLRIYGNSVQESILPSEYQEVEYIESTGTQYIITNFDEINFRVLITAQANATPVLEKQSLFGSTRFDTDSQYNIWLINNTLKMSLCVPITGTFTNDFTNKFTFEARYYSYDNTDITLTINGTTKTKNVKRVYHQATGYIYLFARNKNNEPVEFSKAKIYNVQIGLEDNLERNFIPCYRKADGEIGMYDVVNDVFYTNAGTGSFLKGNDVQKIESVGDFDETTGKYKIPVKVSNETEEITTNIYLDEPLRKVGDYADYIDFEKQKVYKNVEVIDDTGTLILEESLSGVVDNVGTNIELPNIPTLKGTNIIEVDTEIQPSNMAVKYKGLE